MREASNALVRLGQRKAVSVLHRVVSPLMPRRYRLALHYWGRWVIGAPEKEAYHTSVLARPNGTAIDVGANWGLYTYGLSKTFAHVVAFEPNPAASALIRAAKLPNVRLLDAALSSEEGVASLHVPVRKGVVLASWGSLDPTRMTGEADVVRREVRLMRLDDLELQNVTFIKIDVEGHELDALAGARSTIARSRPVCLIEASEETLPEVESFFFGISPDYVRAPAMRNVPLSPGNFLFRPAEKAERGDEPKRGRPMERPWKNRLETEDLLRREPF